MSDAYFTTKRLTARRWTNNDLADLHALRSDPDVMRHFPKLQTLDEVSASLERLKTIQDKYGYGFSAIVENRTQAFVGFAGIAEVIFETHFTPATEIGWSLMPQYWGLGYATEIAKGWLNYGFTKKHKTEIVAFAVTNNHPSHRVMERLGMKRDATKDFDHPNVPLDKPELIRHLTWSLKRSDWESLLK